ncbi:MAG: hypothetical protein IPJ65_10105 [Archangiaceae bacterium]|nr:hypothetical protein [Archangiaceae bacterium]
MSTALAAPRGRLTGLLTVGAVAGTALAVVLALAIDQPLLAVAVPLFVGVVAALYQLPLRAGLFGVLFLVLAFEGLQFGLGPSSFYDVPFFSAVGRVLFLNLSAITGVGPLRAPLIDVATLALFVASMVRHPRDGWAGTQPSVRAMHMALWASAGVAGLLIVLGTVQGGSFDESLWQVRQLLLFPIRAVLVMRALDCNTAELKTIGKLLVAASMLKALIGLWFYYVVAPAAGIELEFTTSHTDTLLFVPTLAMFIAQTLESRTPKQWLPSLFWVPLVFWGLVCNDRRVSYVSLAIGGIVMLVMSPPTPMKRVAARALLLLSPAVPFYVIAGWASEGKGFFFPVGVLKSLIVGEKRFEGAVDYRDLENMNVLYTWSQHKLLPAGFGQKFDMLFHLPDISTWFASWQYHPHNSYLWLLTIGGPIGFTVMVMPQIATLYLAARAYRASRDFTERVALLTAIATVIAFFNQMWGDMGTLSWTVSWTAAVAAAISAKLAMKTGAWPAVFRVKREYEL